MIARVAQRRLRIRSSLWSTFTLGWNRTEPNYPILVGGFEHEILGLVSASGGGRALPMGLLGTINSGERHGHDADDTSQRDAAIAHQQHDLQE